MSSTLLDTDVVINILKKREDTINLLNTIIDTNLSISVITVAKIYAGARAKEIPTIEKLFSFFEIVNIDKIAGDYAKKYKKAYCGISLEDYLIAATAKDRGFKLWS